MDRFTYHVPPIAGATRGAVRRALARWYASARRDLPWRRSRDPYAIWVSEVMLQQTQVKTVGPYYQRFLSLFPTVDRLARAEASAVLKAWEGLGYYRRAVNLHRASRMVVEQFGGCIPDTWDDLRTLPGIGDYIAAAVLSIAFGRPHAVVDGNVKRVLARLRCLKAPVNDSAFHGAYQTLADQLLCPHQPGDHNQAMMELGALVCLPRRPLCDPCPLASFCCAREEGRIADFPMRKPRKAVPLQTMVAGVVVKHNRLLLVQRQADGLLGGLWEFPNGSLAADDDPQATCAGHIASQLGIEVVVEHELARVRHAYTHFKLDLSVYKCLWRSGSVRLNGPVKFAWLKWEQLKEYPIHRAVQKALPYIEKGLV